MKFSVRLRDDLTVTLVFFKAMLKLVELCLVFFMAFLHFFCLRKESAAARITAAAAGQPLQPSERV